MYRKAQNFLFSENRLYDVIETNKRRIPQIVGSLTKEQLLGLSQDTLIENVVNQITIDPIKLLEDQKSMDHGEAKIDVSGRFEYFSGDGDPHLVSGYCFKFYIPYTGESGLWRFQPDTFSLNPPVGEINQSTNILTLSFQNTKETPREWYQQQLDSNLQNIRQCLINQEKQLIQFNQSLPKLIETEILRRKEELARLDGLISSFDIPLVKKSGMPDYKLLDVRHRKEVKLPTLSKVGSKAEPAITNDLYEAILGNIRHMGATFEGTPQTYKALGEDGLRDILLASLNSVYEGRATAEAFRHYGKTDIRIETDDRSAFVAECKLWAGPAVLVSALEQLLDYLTWRDCKASLIIFNKSVASFSDIQNTIHRTLTAHSNFIREKTNQPVGEWRFVFRSSEDSSREITVHVQNFNLFVSEKRSTRKR